MSEITVYHGSSVYFEKPDPEFFGQGLGKSEWGWGFNTGTSINVSAEYGGTETDGVLYSYDIDENFIDDKVLVHNEAIGQEKYDRILQAIAEVEDHETAAGISKNLSPQSTGAEAYQALWKGQTAIRPDGKFGAQTLAKHGIGGVWHDNSIIVFFDADDLPPAKIVRVRGDIPEARAALERQRAGTVENSAASDRQETVSTERPAASTQEVSQNVAGNNPQALIAKGGYASEELGHAAGKIQHTGNDVLIERFNDLAAHLLGEDYNKTDLSTRQVTYTQNHGFDLRNGLGLATRNIISDGGLNEDYFGGRESWIRHKQNFLRIAGDDSELVTKLDAFEDALFSHIEHMHGARPSIPELKNPHLSVEALDGVHPQADSALKTGFDRLGDALKIGGRALPLVGGAVAGVEAFGLGKEAHAAHLNGEITTGELIALDGIYAAHVVQGTADPTAFGGEVPVQAAYAKLADEGRWPEELRDRLKPSSVTDILSNNEPKSMEQTEFEQVLDSLQNVGEHSSPEVQALAQLYNNVTHAEENYRASLIPGSFTPEGKLQAEAALDASYNEYEEYYEEIRSGDYWPDVKAELIGGPPTKTDIARENARSIEEQPDSSPHLAQTHTATLHANKLSF